MWDKILFAVGAICVVAFVIGIAILAALVFTPPDSMVDRYTPVPRKEKKK